LAFDGGAKYPGVCNKTVTILGIQTPGINAR
jgi:hypothetical protein